MIALKKSIPFVITAAALLLSATGVGATPITFTFADVPDGGSNSAIQTSMQNVLNSNHTGATVTAAGALASTTYNGEGYVVGPVSGNTVTSYTLATLDGVFLYNNQPSDRITLNFSKAVYSVKFDYEIFPDGSGSTPDFEFAANGNTVFAAVAGAPGSGQAYSSTYTHSPNSGPSAVETNHQYIGSYSGTFSQGVTKLEFIDWPQRIGIAKLTVDFQPTPEPSSIALLGCTMLSFLGVRVRRGLRSPAI